MLPEPDPTDHAHPLESVDLESTDLARCPDHPARSGPVVVEPNVATDSEISLTRGAAA